jgi:hypothetical protein
MSASADLVDESEARKDINLLDVADNTNSRSGGA